MHCEWPCASDLARVSRVERGLADGVSPDAIREELAERDLRRDAERAAVSAAAKPTPRAKTQSVPPKPPPSQTARPERKRTYAAKNLFAKWCSILFGGSMEEARCAIREWERRGDIEVCAKLARLEGPHPNMNDSYMVDAWCGSCAKQTHAQ